MKIGIQIEQRMIYQCSVTDGKIVEEEPKKFSGDWTDYVREESEKHADTSNLFMGVILEDPEEDLAAKAAELRKELGFSEEQLKLLTKEAAFLGLAGERKEELDRELWGCLTIPVRDCFIIW